MGLLLRVSRPCEGLVLSNGKHAVIIRKSAGEIRCTRTTDTCTHQHSQKRFPVKPFQMKCPTNLTQIKPMTIRAPTAAIISIVPICSVGVKGIRTPVRVLA
ncbi:hypothetical protein D3C85_1396610 [compost metagenome]